MLIFLSPVGIFLMWRYRKYNRITRTILSVFFALWFFFYAVAAASEQQQNLIQGNTNTVTESGNKTDSSQKAEKPTQGTSTDSNSQNTTTSQSQIENLKNNNATVTGELKVHFIDVGQADSILLQQDSNFMLVDAGNNGDAQMVKNYLTNQGVKELQYFIGTHKDEDHIGSADYIINSFEVGKVYFPKQTATTKTFKDFVIAVKNKKLLLTVPKVGEEFKLGGATITVLAPKSSSYEDSNDYSIVVKVGFGSTSFLLAGDAEAVSEKEMVASGRDLSATVLKVGHHGSRSSTSQAFLNNVNPKFAVIPVGIDNKYGHPAQETMDRLKNKGVKVFRTDEQGTIIVTSNGKDVAFNVKPGSYKGIAYSGVSPSNDSRER